MASRIKDNLLNKILRFSYADHHLIWLPQQKLGYFRIPKAANSSIRFQLAKTFQLTGKKGLQPNQDKFWAQQDEMQAVNLTHEEFFERTDRDDAWLFTFVRHPVTRLYSCWNNKIIENTTLARAFKKMGVELGMDFPSFVQKVYDAPDEKADIHVRSQASILTREGRLLPHFVGRVECMEADWDHVRFETSIRGVGLGPLRHVNARQKDGFDPTEIIPAPTLKLIRERFEQDFKLFYPRELTKNV